MRWQYCTNAEHTDTKWDEISSEEYCLTCNKIKRSTPQPTSNTSMKNTAEELYKAIGEGYGFNGTKEDAIKLIEAYAFNVKGEVTDEEIEAQATKQYIPNSQYWRGYVAGAKWMRSLQRQDTTQEPKD